MASPVILRRRNRIFPPNSPDRSKFEEMKNPAEKLNSLPFLARPKTNFESAKLLRKAVSDTCLLNWKVKKKELRKIEKQFVEFKMRCEGEISNNMQTILKRKMNDIAVEKVHLEPTYLTFPMQFGSIFSFKNFPFPEKSIFDSLASVFSKNSARSSRIERGVNTSAPNLCKEIQTGHSNENTKTQNVRVRKKSKRTQTDSAEGERALLRKRIDRKRRAAKLTFKSGFNEEQGAETVPNISPGLSERDSRKIASEGHLNPSVFSFSRYNHFMNACGFEMFSNYIPKKDVHRADGRGNKSSSTPKCNPSKTSRTSLQVNTSKSKASTANVKPNASAKKTFQSNTATMDKICSVESKNSIDLIALRNFILKFSPLPQKPSVETAGAKMSKISAKIGQGSLDRSSDSSSAQNSGSKPPRKTKRRGKKRESKDQNTGTDCDEISHLVPRKTKVNGGFEKRQSPVSNLEFRPIVFNQEEAKILSNAPEHVPRRKSAQFRSGLIRKPSKQQTVPAKFVGRRGNIFDYVSCITSTSSTIYSSSESIRKIFVRSKMSVLTVPSDYSSLLQILTKSNAGENIAEIICHDSQASEDGAEDKCDADKVVEVAAKEDRVGEYQQELIVAQVHVEQTISKLVAFGEEENNLSLVTSDEEKVIDVSHYADSDIFDADVEEKQSKTKKYKQFGSRILKTISRLSHRRKLLKTSSDKLYKKKCKEILKEHKIQEECVALNKISSCKMQKQYIFNIGQIDGVTTSPVVINLQVHSQETTVASTSRLRSVFNCCVVPKNSNKMSMVVLDCKTQCKKYSDEIIAKEECRAQIVEETSKQDSSRIIRPPVPNNPGTEGVDDLLNKSLEDIRILFKSGFSSETDVSENEMGDQNTKITVQKKMSSTNIQNPQRLIELKVNPSNAQGEKCFVNPISIFVDPQAEAIGSNGRYRIEYLDAIVADSSSKDIVCQDKDFKKPMKIQVNLVLYQLSD